MLYYVAECREDYREIPFPQVHFLGRSVGLACYSIVWYARITRHLYKSCPSYVYIYIDR